ncbi:MAG: hypothetical protein RL885_02220 [Planctomycetota bacterium]
MPNGHRRGDALSRHLIVVSWMVLLGLLVASPAALLAGPAAQIAGWSHAGSARAGAPADAATGFIELDDFSAAALLERLAEVEDSEDDAVTPGPTPSIASSRRGQTAILGSALDGPPVPLRALWGRAPPAA